MSRKDYPVNSEDEGLQDSAPGEAAESASYMPEGSVEEQADERNLRPASFDEFIGQAQVVDNLRIAVKAALDRGEALDHILLSGMPGLGKTTIAMLLGAEMGAGKTHVLSGPTLERGKDVVGTLTQLASGDILFIDEVHRMSSHAEEYLYSAMEDFRVAATTREGLLSAPLRSRFQIVEKLDCYPVAELAQIIERSAGLLGCEIKSDA